jgi:TolA-binding protein
MLTAFTDNYPESPYINNAFFYMGESQFEKKQYAVALKTFANVNRNDLNKQDMLNLTYQSGYAHMMTENLQQAGIEFAQVKDANTIYSKPATYYYAHIMYIEEKFPEALDGFKKLNSDPAYSKVIPMYISHIYYKQQNYAEVVNYTGNVIKDVEKEQKPELSKILGDSYFHLGQYENALPFMEAYFDATKLQTREESYVLGYSYHYTGSYFKAAPLLEKASKGDDELAQNAYYHLADCYIKINEKEKAKMAYDAASKLNFDEKIKEEALFNYAKLTYELSFSPFNETIKAFDTYIETYPDSEHNTEAYQILSEVYMVTKNYKDAITSMEKIKVKTPAILKAYQRVTFYRGLELFNNLIYQQAIGFFDKSLENNQDQAIYAQTLYWKAEALYRTGNYNEAINNFVRFLTSNGASVLPEFNNARYNLAYAYFKLNDYDLAVTNFSKYIDATKGNRSAKLADALNRQGDVSFLKTDYTKALQYYQQSFNLKLFEPDYSLYQIAFCKGLQRDYQGKITNLEQLLSNYPESAFQDDALYELGRAYERLGETGKATIQYNNIVQNHKQSAFYRKAMLQLGLMNFNNEKYEQALAQYKEVAEKFPETTEAQTAFLGIKNCYIEMNNVEGYFNYTKQLGNNTIIRASEQDSLTFMAAERMYMAGDKNTAAQLNRYLQQYPDGSFGLNAHFYLAETLYKDGKFTDANTHYTFVANQPENIFSEQAVSRAAELTLNAGNHAAALDLCNRLEAMASNKWNTMRANTGQMRCYFALKDYNNALIAAGKIKKSETASEAVKREAGFVEGKSFYMTGKIDKALEGLKATATDVNFEQGAEAKYLVAEILFKQKNIQKSEAEIIDFIDKNTPHQFWLGKAFILLADIYIERNDDFQAKHTLKSLVENYNTTTDGIIEEASKKLSVIEKNEKQEQQNAIDSSFQMKIKQ